jgi:hypothetical protein
MIRISHTVLRKLEDAAAYFAKPTGDAVKDEYHKWALAMFSSPDSSGIQEQILAEACGSVHKGGKKLGADAVLDGKEIEIKPCKSEKPVTSVNITDDQPARLIKDLHSSSKILVIGRCPGGIRFRWVVACPLSDFAQTRYLAMCAHWKHAPEEWPTSVEEQIKLVERLAEKRTKNNYLRSSQLKFSDIQTILGSWVHPDIEVPEASRRSEDALMQKLAQRQTSPPRKP